MKKLIALLGAALLALGAQAAPAGHGTHAAKAPKLAQAKGKALLAAKGTQVHKAEANNKAAKRKKAAAHKQTAPTKAASRKARNKRG